MVMLSRFSSNGYPSNLRQSSRSSFELNFIKPQPFEFPSLSFSIFSDLNWIPLLLNISFTSDSLNDLGMYFMYSSISSPNYFGSGFRSLL
jgi:hypothetical protein